jgi:hypothetical protein
MADTDEADAYPVAWGCKPRSAGALEAAFDVYAASLSDEEWVQMVERTRRPGGGR